MYGYFVAAVVLSVIIWILGRRFSDRVSAGRVFRCVPVIFCSANNAYAVVDGHWAWAFYWLLGCLAAVAWVAWIPKPKEEED